MARRANIEQRLIALNTTSADADTLRPFIADPSSHVVAKAAKIVRDERVDGLDAEMRAAFTRCLEDPGGRDPGCAAKLALLEALDFTDHDDEEPFRVAARYVQLEPAFGDPVDTAPPLRIRGALGLIRLRASDVLTILAEHLADHPTVQSAAARALAEHGDPAGAALIRLRIQLGMEDGEVLTDCLCALLTLDPNGLEYVTARLNGRDGLARRAAALAMGEMRPEGAFELLRDLHDRSVGDDREVARTAIGLLRDDRARAFLDETGDG